MEECSHLDQIRKVHPHSKGSRIVSRRGLLVHLRLCLECGHVGCCDSSKNKHATRHFHQTRHPVVRSFEPENRGAGATSMRSCWNSPDGGRPRPALLLVGPPSHFVSL